MAKGSTQSGGTATQIREIADRIEQLDQERAELQQELASLASGEPVTVQAAPRRGTNRGGGRGRGRPAGRKKAARKKVSRKASTGARRAGRGGRDTRRQHMLQTMPGPDHEEGMTRDEIASLVEKNGFQFNTDKPEVGIGQELGHMRDEEPALAEQVSHGRWRLTKAGEKQRQDLEKEQKSGGNGNE